jgi:hypothetical protein
LIGISTQYLRLSPRIERGFSAVKRIKSDRRSNLRTETMNHLLLASIEGPALEDYNAELDEQK